MSIAFLPDGRRLVTGAFDGTVKIWDTTSGAELMLVRREQGRVRSVAVSPGGQILAIAARNVKLWDASNGKPGIQLAQKTREVDYLAFSPDGDTLTMVEFREVRKFKAPSAEGGKAGRGTHTRSVPFHH